MGTLGKVLLFVNLLAAAGVAYLATQNWAARQDVTANALQYHVVLAGIQVAPPAGAAADEDAVPFVAEMSGGYKTATVTPTFLATYFQGADGGQQFGGGGVVSSQVEEVKRVQGKATSLLAALPPDGQLAMLCGRETPDPSGVPLYVPGWLTALATTFEERLAVRRLATVKDPTDPDPVREQERLKANLDRARAILEKKFATALSEPNAQLAAQEADRLAEVTARMQAVGAKLQALAAQPMAPEDDLRAATDELEKARTDYLAALADLGTAAARGEPDRRKRIAHLLTFLDPTAAWQKRVALVVGLRTYRDTLSEQSDRLARMATIAEAQILHDQQSFNAEYAILRSDAERRTLLLTQQQVVRADLDRQRAADVGAITTRNKYLADRATELAQVRAEVEKQLAAQRKAEAELFAVQKRVGDRLQQNLALEDRLAEAEATRASQATRTAP